MPLLEICTVHLYRQNAFRVIERPVHTKTREIVRRLNDLKLAAEMGELAEEYGNAFRLDPLPSINQIKTAGQRLQNVESRFVDEFFWFWPLSWTDAEQDQALAALEDGNVEKAESLWRRGMATELNSREALNAKHNIAVLSHYRALKQEHETKEKYPAVSDNQIYELDAAWKVAFLLWDELIGDESFWSMIADRVRSAKEAGLTTGFIKRFRESLPVAFYYLTASFASTYASMGKNARADAHIRYLEESLLGRQGASKALQRATRPLHDRIDYAVKRAMDGLNEEPLTGLDRAKELVLCAEEPLRILEFLLPSCDAEIMDTFDEVANAHSACIVVYSNASSDWFTCIQMLAETEKIARGDTLKSKINDNIVAAQDNYEADKLNRCWFCKQNRKSDLAELTVLMYGNVQTIRTAESNRMTWDKRCINVPRCASCKSGRAGRGEYGRPRLRKHPDIEELLNKGWEIGSGPPS